MMAAKLLRVPQLISPLGRCIKKSNYFTSIILLPYYGSLAVSVMSLEENRTAIQTS